MKLKRVGWLPICIKSEYQNEVGEEWPAAYAWTLKMAKSDAYGFAPREFRYIQVYAKASDLRRGKK